MIWEECSLPVVDTRNKRDGTGSLSGEEWNSAAADSDRLMGFLWWVDGACAEGVDDEAARKLD